MRAAAAFLAVAFLLLLGAGTAEATNPPEPPGVTCPRPAFLDCTIWWIVDVVEWAASGGFLDKPIEW
jgi:hypothetical protein